MDKQNTVSEIVADNFNTSMVFAKYGIDFCCGGQITLEEACLKKDIPLQEILLALEAISNQPEKINDKALSASELIQKIIEVHHQYIQTSAPAIQMYLDKLVKVHGQNHPELIEIKSLFEEAWYNLQAHMKKEEKILFPYVEAMEEAINKHFPLAPPHFGHVDNPIGEMEEEHLIEGDRFKTISALSNQYTVPADGCRTYAVTYALLREFEEDLHRHIHLENNVLFPKAKSLYKFIQVS